MELHVTDVKGHSRPFIIGAVNIAAIQWRPDSSGIAFLSKYDGGDGDALCFIPIDGGGLRRLVDHPTSVKEFEWRNNGEQIAYIASGEPDRDSNRLKAAGFTPEIVDEQPVFDQIWICDVKSGAQLTPRQIPVEGQPSDVHFSPDGTRLVVAVAPTPSIDDYYMFRRLKVLNATDGSVLAEIENPGKLGAIHWSLDGNEIYFCSGEDLHDPSAGRLMAAPASGGTPHQVMPDYLPNIHSFQWHDNQHLQFIAEDGCLTAWGSVARDGSERTMIFGPNPPIISSFSVSRDHDVVGFCAQQPNIRARFSYFKKDTWSG